MFWCFCGVGCSRGGSISCSRRLDMGHGGGGVGCCSATVSGCCPVHCPWPCSCSGKRGPLPILHTNQPGTGNVKGAGRHSKKSLECFRCGFATCYTANRRGDKAAATRMGSDGGVMASYTAYCY